MIIIGLVFAAFLFPPIWGILAVYLIYLALTKNSRQSNLLMREIQNSIINNREEVVLNKVGYGAAKKFAAANGASMSMYKNDPEDDTLFFNIRFNDSEYEICVQRWLINSTFLTVKPEGERRSELIDRLGKDHFLSKHLNNK